MPDIGKVIERLQNVSHYFKSMLKVGYDGDADMYRKHRESVRMAIELLKERDKEIEALRLLVEWAEECDFGFDQFRVEYERYKDEIKDMKYIDGMIHVAKRTLEDQGAFEEGR